MQTQTLTISPAAPPLRGYAASINRYTGVTDLALLAEIEDLMRDEHRTLDHLSPEAFARCARESLGLAAYLRTPQGRAEADAAYRAVMGAGA